MRLTSLIPPDDEEMTGGKLRKKVAQAARRDMLWHGDRHGAELKC
jgi:hypothetical protein